MCGALGSKPLALSCYEAHRRVLSTIFFCFFCYFTSDFSSIFVPEIPQKIALRKRFYFFDNTTQYSAYSILFFVQDILKYSILFKTASRTARYDDCCRGGFRTSLPGVVGLPGPLLLPKCGLALLRAGFSSTSPGKCPVERDFSSFVPVVPLFEDERGFFLDPVAVPVPLPDPLPFEVAVPTVVEVDVEDLLRPFCSSNLTSSPTTKFLSWTNFTIHSGISPELCFFFSLGDDFEREFFLPVVSLMFDLVFGGDELPGTNNWKKKRVRNQNGGQLHTFLWVAHGSQIMVRSLLPRLKE